MLGIGEVEGGGWVVSVVGGVVGGGFGDGVGVVGFKIVFIPWSIAASSASSN